MVVLDCVKQRYVCVLGLTDITLELQDAASELALDGSQTAFKPRYSFFLFADRIPESGRMLGQEQFLPHLHPSLAKMSKSLSNVGDLARVN
jgi:hypothetical protein